MAEVISPDHHSRHAGSVDSSAPAGPVITMVSNPDFTFPVQPRATPPDRQTNAHDAIRRPASASMHIDIPRSDFSNAHRRTASTLPSFAFNSTDTSGRKDDETPPTTPDEGLTATPGRRGHRRGGSEFVGGDSRLGVSNAVSSSPTKTTAPPEAGVLATGPSNRPRRHSHRRSAAISSHDLANLMQAPTDTQPRLSSSLPCTPLEHPMDVSDAHVSDLSLKSDHTVSDPFNAALDNTAARPPSRPRVGFSDNVEFIPRPLSTISSETGSSISTVRGHSVNNSISSVLSLSTPSPPSTRPSRFLNRRREDDVTLVTESSVDMNNPTGKQGQALWFGSSEKPERPMSESAVNHPKTTFAEPDSVARPRKRALTHAFGLDRRRSEPSMGINSSEPSRLSAASLHESESSISDERDAQDSRTHEPILSAKKIKDWATAKITKRAKEANKCNFSLIRPLSAESTSTRGEAPVVEAPVAETDLETVFSSCNAAGDFQRPDTPSQPRIDINTASASQYIGARSLDADESDAVLDLDAALGPFKTPPIGSHRQRKELHSSRLTKDFNGPGGHYYRRSESDPILPPVEFGRDGARPQPGMADVFEEEEEDATNVVQSSNATSIYSGKEGAARIVVGEVDLSDSGSAVSLTPNTDDGLGIRGAWELDRPPSSHSSSRSMSAHAVLEGRGSSIIEETIMEEGGPGDEIEIVESHEEPRASSQTKSSDSSDTPTVLAAPIVPEGQQSLMTPDTYPNSTLSSPALRPSSFDTNRLDTAASSIADNRTTSSCATGEHGHELRVSVDVPSLTSSRSTMISSVPGNNSRRDFGNADRTLSVNSQLGYPYDENDGDRQRKRGSIQSLSQLVGGPFGAKTRALGDSRPQTSSDSGTTKYPKKQHRLKKLMFWKSKNNSNQNLQRDV